jgi:hypothetical protein
LGLFPRRLGLLRTWFDVAILFGVIPLRFSLSLALAGSTFWLSAFFNHLSRAVAMGRTGTDEAGRFAERGILGTGSVLAFPID